MKPKLLTYIWSKGNGPREGKEKGIRDLVYDVPAIDFRERAYEQWPDANPFNEK